MIVKLTVIVAITLWSQTVGCSEYSRKIKGKFIVESKGAVTSVNRQSQSALKIAVFIEKNMNSKARQHVDPYKLAYIVANSKRPKMLAAQGAAESGFYPYAKSSKNAEGIFQFAPYPRQLHKLDFQGQVKEAEKRYEEKLLIVKGNKRLALERYCGRGKEAVAYSKRVRNLMKTI